MVTTRIEVLRDSELFELNLKKGQEFSITRQCNDLQEISSINFDYSNNIEIPATKYNLRCFGFASTPQQVNDIVHSTFVCRVYSDNILILENGLLFITKITSDTIYLTIYNKIADFLEIISRYDLKDIAYSFPDISWTISDIADNVANTFIQGVKFPCCKNTDFGLKDDTLDYCRADLQFPAVFTMTLIGSIISSSGFTISGTGITLETNYQNLMLSLNQKYSETQNAIDGLKLAAESTGNITINQTNWKESYFDYTSDDPASQVTQDAVNSLTYATMISDGNYLFQIRSIISSAINDVVGVRMIKYSFGATDFVEIKRDVYNITGGAAAVDNDFLFSVDLKKGDRVYIQHYSDNGGAALLIGSFMAIKSRAYVREAFYKAPLFPRYMLPEMNCLDFMKDIFSLYGISVQYKEGLIYLHTFKDIYNNRDHANDWSGKIVLRKNTNELNNAEFALKNFAQRNYYRYNDDDTNNKRVNDFYIESQNENAGQYTTIKKYEFATGQTVAYNDSRTAPFINRFKVEITDDIERVTNVDVSNRLLYDQYDGSATEEITYWDTLDADGNIDLTNAEDGKRPTCAYPAFFKANYLTYLEKLIIDPLYIVENFDLTILDVINYDFSVPVYIQQFSAYFYVLKINNFIPGKLTEVELLRIS